QKATHCTTRADVYAKDPQSDAAVQRERFKIYVVHADDFTAVHIDDLLIEQIATQQQHAFGTGELRPRICWLAGTDPTVHVLESVTREEAIALRRLDNKVEYLVTALLRSQGNFAHSSCDRAAGI